MPVNLSVPLALASLPVALSTLALPTTLKTWPASSPQPLEAASTLNALVPPPPLSVPLPPNGTHGCCDVSPLPLPVILPAPISVPLPLPVAEMSATSSVTLVTAVPAYLPVNAITFVDVAAPASAPPATTSAQSATTIRVVVRNLTVTPSVGSRVPRDRRRERHHRHPQAPRSHLRENREPARSSRSPNCSERSLRPTYRGRPIEPAPASNARSKKASTRAA